MKTKEEKLWNYLVKELSELKDNNYKARKIFDKVQSLALKDTPQQTLPVLTENEMDDIIHAWQSQQKQTDSGKPLVMGSTSK